jgi:hypothetical protein
MVYNLTQYKFVYDFTIIEIAKMFSKENINWFFSENITNILLNILTIMKNNIK